MRDSDIIITCIAGLVLSSLLQDITILLQGPVVTSMIKASLKMIGISIILLITFLCLALPGLIFHHLVETDFPKYLAIWKVCMFILIK